MKFRIVERKDYDGYKKFVVQRRFFFWWLDVKLFNGFYGFSYTAEFDRLYKAEDAVSRMQYKSEDKVINFGGKNDDL